MWQKIKKLNLKLTIAIGTILVVFMMGDMLFSIYSTRQTSLKEIQRWSVLLAETVRVSLNTLMKEEKMNARFEMFDAIRLEIHGLEHVRVIRAPKVNEIFRKVNEQRDIPIEQEAINDYRQKINELTTKLHQTKNSLERQDLQAEIADAQNGIADAEKKIVELRTIKSDERELPVSDLDYQVLATGKPIFHAEGDTLRVWAPYVARKTCGEASGCHSGVNDGDVLGAVHMQFSLAQINRDMIKDALLAALGKALLVAIIIGALVLMINVVVIRNIHTIQAALHQFSKGNLKGRIKVRGKDEVQQLAQGINTFIDRFCDMLDQVEREKLSAEENEERLKVVIDNAGEGIITVDAKGTVQSFNAAAEAIFGYTASAAKGRNFVEFVSGLPAGEVGKWEITGKRKGGDEFPLEVSVREAHMHGQSQFVCILEDITARKDAEQRLNKLANYDSLTGLPNRNLFKDRLAQALKRADRNKSLVALMFLDLDRFKVINDTLGHDAGDRLLQHVANSLTHVLRKSDTVALAVTDANAFPNNDSTVARLGGDEFTITIEGFTKVEYVATIAQKIIDVFAQPVYLGEHELHVSTSIGIAIYPLDDTSQEGLIKDADSAMYRSKEMGRNTYQFYTKDINATVSDRFQLEKSLRGAIEHNEFVLHYQPKIDIASGKIVGVEALIRWQHPDKGLVFPDEFIPMLEETGLIMPVGEWVLRTACAQNQAWQKQGDLPLQMAVNLSPHQFTQENLAERFAAIILETGMDPKLLELELTESMLMAHSDSSIAALQALAKLGILVSIDDFGTGYSSLSYLKRFALHALKIDQSFVRDIANNADDAAIATAIIAMGNSLRLQVIAEGVENQEQLDVLRALGCHQAQGYFLGAPMSADLFVKHMRQASIEQTGQWKI
ncbi:MAG: EAL domain-containing protein [Gallionellaceae bacterium]|nr:EAL domain-containing protein [Gallionellaceae bacterium]